MIITSLFKGVGKHHVFSRQNRRWENTGYKFEEPKCLNPLSALQDGMSIT